MGSVNGAAYVSTFQVSVDFLKENLSCVTLH